MKNYTRRDFLQTTAAVAAASALGQQAFAAALPGQRYVPEKDAKLRVLRWKRFVQGDEDVWLANTKKFTQMTGIEVWSTAKAGKTCGQKLRSPPMSAAARTSSAAPSRIRTCTPTSWST